MAWNEFSEVTNGGLSRRTRGIAVACFSLVMGVVAGNAVAQHDEVVFNRDVRPILADKCFACHGFDEKKRESGLRLDTFEGATAALSGKQAIVPGNPSDSELWIRIQSRDDSDRMPPPTTHKDLNPHEIEILKRWIEQGARYQKHWSFEALGSVATPNSPPAGRNSIDAFVSARLQKEGWELSPEASKPILIRRVAFTLTGLPPTLSEVEEFLTDDSPNAYERMVDRYLRSSHYGEEMARHWLDVARYADTHGLHLDNERQMWAYRDWVVRSFNRNQLYDQFTIEQLAGDLLPNPTPDQRIATGFNRCNVTTSEGGSIDAEFYYRYAVDRTSTMSSTWMGLTAGCAVCHDHKFDPISTKEFYSLYAFYNASADPAMDGNALLTNPVFKLETEADQTRLAEFDNAIGLAERELDASASKAEYRDPATMEPRSAPQLLESVWLDDEFPPGGKVTSGPGQGTLFVSKEQNEPVFSGTKSLKRTDGGLSQDVWQEATAPLVIPENATLFAYVFLDPANPPKSIMLQFHKGDWLHRAVWGDYEAIPWGQVNTTQRVSMGTLPKPGEWVRLEFPASTVGLSGGDSITGFATTQFGGTVHWDKVGVSGILDPASDPKRSFLAWWRSVSGKDVPGLSTPLHAIAKGGPIDSVDAQQRAALLRHYLIRICVDTQPQFATALSALEKLRAERNAYYEAIPSTFIYKDAEKPRESFVMLRGQYNQPGEKVEAGTPSILPPIQGSESGRPLNRLDLARWLVSPNHPLTARVAVNRFWQQMFGTGLVKTSADFGTQGELPSHPELLDWLALHFQSSGWDVKDLLRTMLTSATFRQSSHVTSNMLERDPENRLLARGPRLRLDAEQLRDNALFVSGLIDLSIGGKGVKPYQPSNVWEPVGFVGSNTRFYQPDRGSALYRRSLYTFFKRTAPPPYMVNFDAPNREQPCTRRERSNTPLQALQLLNDVQHVEAARALAQRMILEGGSTSDERINWLFHTILSREAESSEVVLLNHQLALHTARFVENLEDAKRLVHLGESKPSENMPPQELAAYTLIASTVLNMDETLCRN
jgi:hypothetical protein